MWRPTCFSWSLAMFIAVAGLGVAGCKAAGGDAVCPVLCGSECLPASACSSSAVCPPGAPCDPCSGQCLQLCAIKSDCPADLDCCVSASSNVCLDTQRDRYHCGGCATSCSASADTCLSGECSCGGLGLTCGDKQLCCGGACVAIDERNCGACGVGCDALDGGAIDLAGTDQTSGGGSEVPIALAVDTIAGGAATNLNGVLELGESVVVAPSWRNDESTPLTFTGVASSTSGSMTKGATVSDVNASYPAIAAGAVGSCASTMDCYTVSSAPDASRALHLDLGMLEALSTGTQKTWSLHVGGSFTDVMTSHEAYRAIETVLHFGLTAGCGSGAFCPDVAITRSAISVFVAIALVGPSGTVPTAGSVGAQAYNCAVGGTSVFSDVLPDDPACKFIHYVAAVGIDTGCNNGTFCPTAAVNREQLAVFVAKALAGPGTPVPIAYTDPTSSRHYDCSMGGSGMVHFTDVPATDPDCASVHYLWARGATNLCAVVDAFCPTAAGKRSDAALFIVRGFKLNLYGP